MPALQEPRRERLRGVLAEQGLDAALVTSLVNVRYLTGFTGSNAALLLTQDSAVLATDGRYIDAVSAAERRPRAGHRPAVRPGAARTGRAAGSGSRPTS